MRLEPRHTKTILDAIDKVLQTGSGYGSVTIKFSETMPNFDIEIETHERIRIDKQIESV
jgi:hypothetical protein